MGDEAGQRGVLPRLVSLTGDEIRSLAEAMRAVPVMRSPNSRQQVLDYVNERNRAFNPRHSAVDLEEINNFIVACRADDESFDLLLEAIGVYASRDDPKLYDLKKLAARLLPHALVTCRELRELLALKPGMGAGPGLLAVGMRIAIYGQAGNGDCDLEPADVREAMLLLLDDPSPEEGLRRLLRFADWLAELASVGADDPSIAERLCELAVRVGRAHGMEWQTTAGPMRRDAVGAASATGAQQTSAEDAGTRDPLPERQSQVAEQSAEPKNREHVARAAQGREERRYLVGDNDSALVTLSPHERSLRDLRNAFKRVQPRIFRDPRIRRRELGTAKKALESVGPLVAALGEAAREESEQRKREDLQQLEDDLRRHLEAMSHELATLYPVRSPRAARKPCDRLASEAAEFLDTGAEAIRHMT
jgi:hypothetical protein